MIRADLHNHTSLCKHATGTVSEYLDRAIELGVTDYGFSCHNPMPPEFDPRHRMSPEQLPTYHAMIEQARESYRGKINVSLALEADWAPQHRDYLEKSLAGYRYQYVIGSVHFLDSWGVDDPAQADQWERADVLAVYRDYFRAIGDAAESGLYDIIGHMDLVKIFGFFPQQDYSDAVASALDRIARADIAIEINSAGLRKPVGEIYPSDWILKMAFERGVPITIGADAHAVDQVGQGLDQGIAAARRAGYAQQAIFKDRKRTLHPLPPAIDSDAAV